MALKIVKGNLLDMADEGYFDIIIHGCNCFHIMGGGIARQIAKRWPGAYQADLQTEYGSEGKLGTWSSYGLENGCVIINGYTQFELSSGQDVFEYEAFRHLLKALLMNYPLAKRYGLPWVGCGLAGGNKELISAIIEEELSDKATIVEFE